MPMKTRHTAAEWDLQNIAEDLHICAMSWEPQARLIGDISATELARLARFVLDSHAARDEQVRANREAKEAAELAVEAEEAATLTVSLSMRHDTQASYIRHAENLEAEAQMLTNKAVLLEVRAGRYRQKAKQMQKPLSGE